MGLFVLLLGLLVSFSCGNIDGLFGSSGVLLSFIKEQQLGDRHVGVGFDVVRGVATNVKLFVNATVDIDPLSAKARYNVLELVHHRDVFEMRAKEMHCEFMKGMFVKDNSYRHLFTYPVRGSYLYMGTRSDVLLVLKLHSNDAFGRLDPGFAEALAALPESYDASNLIWEAFFAMFPTHFTESALVGSKLVVSVIVDKAQADGIDLKSVVDGLLHDGSGQRLANVPDIKDRVLVLGGKPSTLEGSARDWTTTNHATWIEDVKRAPTVIGHHLRPVSDLVSGNAGRKAALQAAIEAHLYRSYENWRAEATQHDQTVKLLEVSKSNVKVELRDLEKARKEVKQKLVEQQALILGCEEDVSGMEKITHRCRDEIKAFQKALIECDGRNLNSEHLGDELFACEAKKRLLGCKEKDDKN
jgi:hypothetical protein